MNQRIGVLLIIDDPEIVEAYAVLDACTDVNLLLHSWEAMQGILEKKGWIETTWLETTLSGPERPHRIAPIEPMELAAAVLAHIDAVYPKMWLNVSKSARVSLRNTVARLARGLPQRVRGLPTETAQQRPPRTCVVPLSSKDTTLTEQEGEG